ncbi:MAG: hypothetical protein U0797_00100 [Gemmataceae bacterium]
MADIEGLVAQITQLTEQLTQLQGAVPPADLIQRAQGLAAQVKARTEEAHGKLKDEAMAFAADLKAKAAQLREPKPKPTQARIPHPWEDHQGLDPAQLQRMAESLMRLAKTPPPARH